MRPIKYAIVIGAMNHLDLTRACIESVQQHTDLSQVEVIVVANGCTDGTEAYVQSLGAPFRLIAFAEPLGFARAYNEGMNATAAEFVVLLNNDTVLLDQERGTWLRMLERPFLDHEAMGITGPFMARSEAANDTFLIGFCWMISRRCLRQVGLFDEVFGAGGGEDTDLCIRAKRAGFTLAQVPMSSSLTINGSNGHPVGVGGFPIYHAGHKTLDDVPNYNTVFNRNNDILASRYNSQTKFGNQWERHVFLSHDDIKNDLHRREIARYRYAATHLTGKRVLELGCSTGYARRFLPEGLDYTGIDYDQATIDMATEHYGGNGWTFLCRDARHLNWDELGYFDTIIAYEFLEHLENGKALAQELKAHCDHLFCTTPYNEPPGLLGIWHVLHRLRESDFPEFHYQFIQEDGEIHRSPDHDHGQNLMLFEWERGKQYSATPRILASVSTKDRYDILPLCLQSIAMQTLKPHKVVIFDDGEQKDLRQVPIYEALFRTFNSVGIEWEVIFGRRMGQHHNHEIANMLGYPFVWRLDDDEIAQPDVLDKLMSHFDDDVGAVGGAVFEPGKAQPGGTGTLAGVYHEPNIQWAHGDRVQAVEHLYSSFVYRAGIVHYDLTLSPAAHREETIFSHQLHRKGYRLLVDLSAKTYHYRHATGGIRSVATQFYFDHDDAIFAKHMAGWGVRLINLDVGLGDCIAFTNILPQLKRRYPTLIIGTAYPDVFKKEGVMLIPVAASRQWNRDNVYDWMQRNQWGQSIVSAFHTMYEVTP